VSVGDPHTQIAAGLNQFVTLTRVTFPLRNAWRPARSYLTSARNAAR